MKTLVLMACSASKLDHADQPRRLYTGPMWQTLREHRGELPWEQIFVLSGEFGFINSLNHIQTYDAELTPAKADYLVVAGIHAPRDFYGTASRFGAGPGVADTIRRPAHRDRPPYDRVISAGAGLYRLVFSSWIPELQAHGIITADAEVLQVSGGIGVQRSQLGKWLRETTG